MGSNTLILRNCNLTRSAHTVCVLRVRIIRIRVIGFGAALYYCEGCSKPKPIPPCPPVVIHRDAVMAWQGDGYAALSEQISPPWDGQSANTFATSGLCANRRRVLTSNTTAPIERHDGPHSHLCCRTGKTESNGTHNADRHAAIRIVYREAGRIFRESTRQVAEPDQAGGDRSYYLDHRKDRIRQSEQQSFRVRQGVKKDIVPFGRDRATAPTNHLAMARCSEWTFR